MAGQRAQQALYQSQAFFSYSSGIISCAKCFPGLLTLILQINISQRQSCLMDVCTHLSISNRQCCCNYTLCTPATFYPRGLALLTFHMKQNDSKMTEQRPTVRQCANKDSIYLLCPHQRSANITTATRKHCLLSGALQPLSVKASA